MNTETYTIPTYLMPYYINGDGSNLSPNEVKMADEFIDENGIAIVGMPKDNQESYFSSNNDVGGLACSVYDIECVHHNDLSMAIMKRAKNNQNKTI